MCPPEMRFGPAYEILVFIAYVQKHPFNDLAGVSSKARGLNFGLRLHLHPY